MLCTILQQKSISRHVHAGTCTISFIIPKNANIYVNGLNSCNVLKQWWGSHIHCTYWRYLANADKYDGKERNNGSTHRVAKP